MTCFFANSRRHFAPRLAPMPRISRASVKINYNHSMQNMPYAVGQLFVERTRSDCPACGFAHVLSAPAAFSLVKCVVLADSACWRARKRSLCGSARHLSEAHGGNFVGRRGTTIIHRAHEHVCALVRARRALGLDRAENLKKRVKIR